jgi:hypothetical protein
VYVYGLVQCNVCLWIRQGRVKEFAPFALYLRFMNVVLLLPLGLPDLVALKARDRATQSLSPSCGLCVLCRLGQGRVSSSIHVCSTTCNLRQPKGVQSGQQAKGGTEHYSAGGVMWRKRRI